MFEVMDGFAEHIRNFARQLDGLGYTESFNYSYAMK